MFKRRLPHSHLFKVKSMLTLCYKSTYGYSYRQESDQKRQNIIFNTTEMPVLFITKIKVFYAFNT